MVQRDGERRAKVGGTCVIADGKFQPSGISGRVTCWTRIAAAVVVVTVLLLVLLVVVLIYFCEKT